MAAGKFENSARFEQELRKEFVDDGVLTPEEVAGLQDELEAAKGEVTASTRTELQAALSQVEDGMAGEPPALDQATLDRFARELYEARVAARIEEAKPKLETLASAIDTSHEYFGESWGQMSEGELTAIEEAFANAQEYLSNDLKTQVQTLIDESASDKGYVWDNVDEIRALGDALRDFSVSVDLSAIEKPDVVKRQPLVEAMDVIYENEGIVNYRLHEIFKIGRNEFARLEAAFGDAGHLLDDAERGLMRRMLDKVRTELETEDGR